MSRLARRKTLAIALVGLAPLLVRLLLLPWMPLPAPRIHDELRAGAGAAEPVDQVIDNSSRSRWERRHPPPPRVPFRTI
jgi:hypothetical protein